MLGVEVRHKAQAFFFAFMLTKHQNMLIEEYHLTQVKSSSYFTELLSINIDRLEKNESDRNADVQKMNHVDRNTAGRGITQEFSINLF